MNGNNFIKITVNDRRIAFESDLPEVVAAFEPLQIRVVWQSTYWMALRVYDFSVGGTKLEMEVGEVNFLESEGSVVKDIKFKHPVDEDTVCKY